jgi:hypothetical protein
MPRTSGPAAQSAEFQLTTGSTSTVGAAKWSQPGGLGSTITITYSYNNLLDGGLGGGLSAASIRSAIEEALGRWAAVAPIRFVEVADSGPALTANMSDYNASGRPMLRFGHIPIDGPSGTLGYAYYPGSTGLAGDVFFDRAESWSVNATRGIDLIEVALHEIGHTLGLGHEPMPSSGGQSAIMNPYYGGRFRGPGTSYLLTDDINGIRTLYGTGTGSVTPLISAPTGDEPTPREVTGASFTDNFNRPNSYYLGAEWATQLGNIQISNNKAAGGIDGTSLATLRGVSTRDSAVQADVNIVAGSGAAVGLMARYSGPGQSNFYLAEAFGTPGAVTVSIYRNVGGVYTLLATTTVGSAVGTLRFEAVGSSLKLFLGDQLQLRVNDSVLAGEGTVGIRTSGRAGSITLDNFQYQQMTLSAAATLPFSDTFTTAVRGQLSDKYVEQSGSFRVTGGVAVNASGVALATLRGASQRDQVLMMDVNLAAGSGASVGLVARHTGVGEGSHYLAEVYAAPGASRVQVSIYVRQASGYRLLSTTTAASGVGLLRFEVIGPNLKLFLNNNLMAAVTDFTLSEPGSAGLRATGAPGTSSVDNFVATVPVLSAAATLPFTDTFSTAVRGQLSDKYVEQVGNFLVSGGVAANNSGVALATLRGATQRDQSLSLDINVAAGSGASVGLVARHTGTGEGSHYLAEVYGAPGSSRVQVSIYVRTASGYRLLASTTAASGTGELRFEVVGSSQMLYLNNVLMLATRDATLDGSTGASAGFRASGPIGSAAFDNFTVR